MVIKYKWLAEKLTALAETNLKNGITKLPTEAELGRRYHVSRQTVRQALSLLETEGIIEKRQGSGSFLTGRLSLPENNLVEILIATEQDYLYPQVLHDIRQSLSKSGFSVHISATDNRIAAERELLLSFLKHPPRGLLAHPCKSALPSPNADLYRALAAKGTALVFLYSCCPGLEEIPCVRDDNAGGSALLIQHLAAQGHRAIAGIFKADDLQGVERYRGFTEAMAELSLPLPDERVGWYHSADFSRLLKQQDFVFLENFAREALANCTAVVCHNDILAWHLIRVLKKLGVLLPDEIAVTAFDNTYLSRMEEHPFTTLTHAPHEIGEKAAALMLQRLKGLPAQSQEVPWELLIRESTRHTRK